MHELGIVFHIRDLLLDTAKENNIAHIYRVSVNIGEVSGVVTELFSDAWRWAADKTEVLDGAEIEINQIEARTICNDCKHVYNTVKFAKKCPNCESLNTELLCGDELEISEIEVD